MEGSLVNLLLFFLVKKEKKVLLTYTIMWKKSALKNAILN